MPSGKLLPISACCTILLSLFIIGQNITPNRFSTTSDKTISPLLPTVKTLNFNKVYGLGDSITFGHRECYPTDANCVIEPQTYVYLYAKSVLPNRSVWGNFGASGTTAAGEVNGLNSAINSPNSFINKQTELPDIIPADKENLTLNNKTGEQRAKLGEFKNINQAEVLIAYGRNDVGIPSISVEDFKKALITISQTIKQNTTNTTTLLTIPPIAEDWWPRYFADMLTVRRPQYAPLIKDPGYPVELDSFFSAQVWEAAFETNSFVVPVHEYLLFHPQLQYFSSDGLHPSGRGQQILADIILNYKNKVIKTTTESVLGDQFLVTSNSIGYGQVVFRENNGDFYYSQPFEITPGQNLVFSKMKNTVIYSTVPISVNGVISN
jgi:lysophospholipase L1-like esterase